MISPRSVVVRRSAVLVLCSLWLTLPGCKKDGGSSVTGPSDSSGSSSGPLVIDLARTSITGARGSYTYTVTVGLKANNDVNVRYLDMTLYSDQGHTAQLAFFRIAASELLSQGHLDSGKTYQTTPMARTDPQATNPYAATAKLEVVYADNSGHEGLSVSAFVTVPPLPSQ